MISVAQITSAKSWLDLRVPKTKTELRRLQREVHPDVCDDPRAPMAFAKLMELYSGPDYDMRVASGTAVGDHKIAWKPKATFEDRLSVARSRLTSLSNLEDKFAMFFPRNIGTNLDELTVEYGRGWYFISGYGFSFDSRTVVWMAKRLAGALNQSTKLGFVHGNISPDTVAIMPAEHGLKIDGWWHSVKVGERLALKPDTKTPPKYFGGFPADNKIDIAQSAAMLQNVGKPDKLIAEVLGKHSVNPGTPVEFFNDIDDAARKLYGKNSWHPLALPKQQMI